MNEIRRAFDEARALSEERSYILGMLGRPDGVIAVADRPGWVYVRVAGQADRSVSLARNPNAVPERLNLPIKMRKEKRVLVIVGLDTGAVLDAATGGDLGNPYHVTKHTHLIGSGLDYLVEAQRLAPGQLGPAGGLSVTLQGFRYDYEGTWKTFPTTTVSLGAYRPSTVGKHRWVLVGVEPATNALAIVAGADYDYATPLVADQLDDIAFGDNLPVGAVQVRYDDTALTSQAKYQDARAWLARAVAGVRRLATVSGLDATSTGQTTIYTVPAGYALVPDLVVVRCLTFTAGAKSVQAIASVGGNASTYDDWLNSVTLTIGAADVAIRQSVAGAALPIYAPATAIKLAIETASDADLESWAVDLFGYLV